ncbi:MAG: hypothetical protein ACQKBW_06425 [Puniceicoccales bacterium]
MANTENVSLTSILRKHRRAQADIAKIYSADTLRLKGETEQQGQTYRFTLYKKSPNLLRYEIDYKERSFVIIYDGSHGYYWSPDESDRPVEVAGGAQEMLLQHEASFDGVLLGASALGYRTELQGSTDLPDQPNPVFHILLYGAKHGGLIDVYIDSSTYLEVQRSFRPSENDPPLVTRFGDYRRVEGFMIPFKIENTYEGKLLSQTRVLEADLNAGILGFFFELPKAKR